MAEDGLLYSEVSPNGNVEAYVEQDERVACFYLQGAPETQFGLRACWVRNLQPAPEALNVADMRAGRAPLLPLQFCRHPAGAPPLSPSDDVRVVWFEEGDAAALLAGQDVLAVIPSWSGQGGFDGYARDCIGESPLCWELGTPQETVLHERIARADEFWASWEADPTPWPMLQQRLCDALQQHLGPEDKYYAIDGGEWPPKAMLRIPRPNGTAFVTAGVSIRPQPRVELFTDEPQKLRRIELGIGLGAEIAESVCRAVMGYLSAQTNFPWDLFTWLGPYHTLPCDAFAAGGADSAFTSVILLPDPMGVPRVTLPTYRGDTVNLLWMAPITKAERKFAMDEGGEALAERLSRVGHGGMHTRRTQVRLD